VPIEASAGSSWVIPIDLPPDRDEVVDRHADGERQRREHDPFTKDQETRGDCARVDAGLEATVQSDAWLGRRGPDGDCGKDRKDCSDECEHLRNVAAPAPSYD
jgi:hypothetical protein